MFNKSFWTSVSERAVKTFAQVFITLIGTAQIGINHLDWQSDLSLAGTAALVSVLTSLASLSTIATAPNPQTVPAVDSVKAAAFDQIINPTVTPDTAPEVVTPVYTQP